MVSGTRVPAGQPGRSANLVELPGQPFRAEKVIAHDWLTLAFCGQLARKLHTDYFVFLIHTQVRVSRERATLLFCKRLNQYLTNALRPSLL